MKVDRWMLTFVVAVAAASLACGSARQGAKDSSDSPMDSDDGSGGSQAMGGSAEQPGGSGGNQENGGVGGASTMGGMGGVGGSNAAGGSGGTPNQGGGTPGGTGGSAGAAPLSGRSVGCGKAATGTSSYERKTIMVGTTPREYFLYLPRTYNSARAYPLIFRWHGAGGNGTSGGLGIEQSSKEDAIIVSPTGLDNRWTSTNESVDVKLFDALLDQMSTDFCINTKGVFSYGFSSGGYMTNTLGCTRSHVVRGVAPVAGGDRGTNCSGQVAAWITHGATDATVVLQRGETARDRYLQANGCAATITPTSPSPCVSYAGCVASAPVVWCQTASGHNPQGGFTGPGAWNFFKSLL